MKYCRFEVPIRDFIDFYIEYFNVDIADRYSATSNCVWFYSTFMDLPEIDTFLLPVLNELNTFDDLLDLDDGDENGDMETELYELIEYHLNDYAYLFEAGDFGNEEYMLERSELPYELLLLMTGWLEYLAEYVDRCFRSDEFLEIRRINHDAFVYAFV